MSFGILEGDRLLAACQQRHAVARLYQLASQVHADEACAPWQLTYSPMHHTRSLHTSLDNRSVEELLKTCAAKHMLRV